MPRPRRETNTERLDVEVRRDRRWVDVQGRVSRGVEHMARFVSCITKSHNLELLLNDRAKCTEGYGA